MSHQLKIQVAGLAPETVELTSGSSRIGREPGSEVRIDHPEVSAQAAVLQNRGGAMLVQNLNSYPVYVGSDAIAPSAWADWPAGQTLQLTRSVSLELVDASEPTGEVKELDDEEARRKKTMSTINLAIIIACCVGIVFLLTVDNEGGGSKKLKFTSESLVVELTEKIVAGQGQSQVENKNLRRYLQKAWSADQRLADKDPQRVVQAYEYVLYHPLVRNAPESDEELYGKIRKLTRSRLQVLKRRIK